MLRAAKIFALILDRKLFRHSEKPLLLSSRGFLFFILLFGMLLSSCSSSDPRFVSKDVPSQHHREQKKKGSIRFSSKEAEEEQAEDDKKVNIPEAVARFSSKKKEPAPKKIEKDIKQTSAAKEPFNNQKMMDAILAWMGTPYEFGGESRSGIDCSAFTREMFKQTAGIELPRTTDQQVKIGSPVQKDDLLFGDLIFFNTTGQNPSHVGIYIGDDMFAHASVSAGVTLSSMYSSYYKKRYTEARRVLK